MNPAAVIYAVIALLLVLPAMLLCLNTMSDEFWSLRTRRAATFGLAVCAVTLGAATAVLLVALS